VARLQERFSKERTLSKKLDEEILDAFRDETDDPDVPFLNHPHNRNLWLQFYRRDPVAHLHFSAEKLFDEFTAFVTMHNAEYVRQKISQLKLK
jgi:hypothetical protein